MGGVASSVVVRSKLSAVGWPVAYGCSCRSGRVVRSQFPVSSRRWTSATASFESALLFRPPRPSTTTTAMADIDLEDLQHSGPIPSNFNAAEAPNDESVRPFLPSPPCSSSHCWDCSRLSSSLQ
jgi:hypothetical protein